MEREGASRGRERHQLQRGGPRQWLLGRRFAQESSGQGGQPPTPEACVAARGGTCDRRGGGGSRAGFGVGRAPQVGGSLAERQELRRHLARAESRAPAPTRPPCIPWYRLHPLVQTMLLPQPPPGPPASPGADNAAATAPSRPPPTGGRAAVACVQAGRRRPPLHPPPLTAAGGQLAPAVPAMRVQRLLDPAEPTHLHRPQQQCHARWSSHCQVSQALLPGMHALPGQQSGAGRRWLPMSWPLPVNWGRAAMVHPASSVPIFLSMQTVAPPHPSQAPIHTFPPAHHAGGPPQLVPILHSLLVAQVAGEAAAAAGEAEPAAGGGRGSGGATEDR